MRKFKDFWHTPLSKLFDSTDKDFDVYDIVKFFIPILIAITVILAIFGLVSSINNTTNTGIYTEKPVETTVSQANQNVLQTNETGLFNIVTVGNSFLIGNVPITIVLIILIVSTVIGSLLCDQMNTTSFSNMPGATASIMGTCVDGQMQGGVFGVLLPIGAIIGIVYMLLNVFGLGSGR